AGDGILNLAGSVSGRLESTGSLIDNSVNGAIFLAVPSIAGLVRPVLRASLAARINEQGNRFITLGGDSGLRAYPISEFSGQVAAIGSVELRSRPVKIFISKVGALLFYDVGHAAANLDSLDFQHDIGIGIRGLIPEAQPTVFRFDYAFPLTGRSFFPGRF